MSCRLLFENVLLREAVELVAHRLVRLGFLVFGKSFLPQPPVAEQVLQGVGI